MNKPRKPNENEKNALAFWVAEEMGGFEANDHFSEGRMLVEEAAIAVFEDYVSDSPGYAGKVMMVVWPGGPEIYEAFVWRNGNLTKVNQNPQFKTEQAEL